MSAVDWTDRVFLNDAESPSDFAVFAYAGDSYQVASNLGGGVESGYASGRSRLYSTQDDTTTVQLTFQWVTAAQTAWLVTHRGRVLCFRDHLGRKVFGAFHEAPVTVSTDPRTYAVDSVQITLTSVTWSEAA